MQMLIHLLHILEESATGATFQISNTKLNVPLVTMSIKNNIKFLGKLKQGLKRTISWNRYRSEIITQPINNNLDYMILPAFKSIYRFFVQNQ